MTFRPAYAAAAAVLLLTEAAIALWVDDALIRPYAGDSLGVLLIHCALRAATRLTGGTAALAAFAIAVLIEVSQRFTLVDALGLGGSSVARTILGSAFDPRDIVAYAIGAGIALLIEAMRHRRG